ncbi:uncharacterized protein G2W53_023667 [Senna tora]|uniref:Uncharacterized protein n=1 Tax=Senna tora TaxID=362788 RepID=A0A834WD63_9FABA|nr:uncharacterized protein G2W53_023667 [Senna tora]
MMMDSGSGLWPRGWVAVDSFFVGLFVDCTVSLITFKSKENNALPLLAYLFELLGRLDKIWPTFLVQI